MNFNLAGIIFAFSLSLSLHAGLVAVIVFNAGTNQIGLDNSIIAVEIIAQKSESESAISQPEPQKAVIKIKPKSLNKIPLAPANLEIVAGSSQINKDLSGHAVSGAHSVQLISAPKPQYPFLARLSGFEGVGILELTIAASGLVKSAEILRSTGRTDCDLEAQKTIMEKWKFSALDSTANNPEWKQRVRVKYELSD